MARKTKAEQLVDQRVERVYYKACSGIPISIMDIGKVFAVGAKVVAEGADDETLGAKLRAFVETIRAS